MATTDQSLLAAVARWLAAEPMVESAVLFGSSAATEGVARTDRWTDFDLHLVVRDAVALERLDWARALPTEDFRFAAARPATGGVRKLTVVFAAGQLDLILVPRGQMRLARFGLVLGLQRRNARLAVALDEIHTCICRGYRFLKGEARWGGFYARIATEFAGVRLDDEAVAGLAGVAVVDHRWIAQKLARGELQAAQHQLHASLAAINFRLVRELRLRRGEPLPSFGLARHVESLLSPEELAWVAVDAACTRESLQAAADRSLAGTKALAAALRPGWAFPEI